MTGMVRGKDSKAEELSDCEWGREGGTVGRGFLWLLSVSSTTSETSSPIMAGEEELIENCKNYPIQSRQSWPLRWYWLWGDQWADQSGQRWNQVSEGKVKNVFCNSWNFQVCFDLFDTKKQEFLSGDDLGDIMRAMGFRHPKFFKGHLSCLHLQNERRISNKSLRHISGLLRRSWLNFCTRLTRTALERLNSVRTI